MTHPVDAYNHAEYVRSLEARLAEEKQLLDTAHALICQAVASRNNGGMTTTLTHDEMRAWLLAYADRATNSADAAPQFDPDALRTPDDPLSPNYDPEYSADEVQK